MGLKQLIIWLILQKSRLWLYWWQSQDVWSVLCSVSMLRDSGSFEMSQRCVVSAPSAVCQVEQIRMHALAQH